MELGIFVGLRLEDAEDLIGAEEWMGWNIAILLLLHQGPIRGDGKELIASFLVLLLLVFLGIIGRRYVEDGIHHQIIIFFFSSHTGVQLLVDDVEDARIDFAGDGDVFFGPTLKDPFEIRAPFGGFLEGQGCVGIEVVLHRVGRDHQVKDGFLVVDVLVGVEDYVLHLLCVGGDGFLLNVPARRPDEVGQEDHLDFVQEEKLADGFEDLIDRKLMPEIASLSDGCQKGHHELYLRFAVLMVCFGVVGGDVGLVGQAVLFLHHNKDGNNYEINKFEITGITFPTIHSAHPLQSPSFLLSLSLPILLQHHLSIPSRRPPFSSSCSRLKPPIPLHPSSNYNRENMYIDFAVNVQRARFTKAYRQNKSGEGEAALEIPARQRFAQEQQMMLR